MDGGYTLARKSGGIGSRFSKSLIASLGAGVMRVVSVDGEGEEAGTEHPDY